MRAPRWPARDLELLHRLYPVMDTNELAAKLGRKPKLVRCQAKNYGLTKVKKRLHWTETELATLRALYPDTPTKQIAEQLRRNLTLVYQKAIKLGLRKSEAYLASPQACRLRRGDNVGAAHRFKKGAPPWSKGTKGLCGVQPGCRRTQFKKGQMSGAAQHNYVPIGTEKILGRDGCLVRKITDDPSIYPARRWVSVHRLVWEAANGRVPPGHIVVFKRGLHTTVCADITLDRLELVSWAENMRRNTYHRYGKDIARLVQLRGALNRQINKRARA